MPEATVLFFYVTALYLFCRWLDEQTPATLLLAAGTTGLASLSIHLLVWHLRLLERRGWSATLCVPVPKKLIRPDTAKRQMPLMICVGVTAGMLLYITRVLIK